MPEKRNFNVFNPPVDKVGKVIVESFSPVTLFNSRKINLRRREEVWVSCFECDEHWSMSNTKDGQIQIKIPGPTDCY